MKRTQLFLLPFLVFIMGSMACKTDSPIPTDQPSMPNPANPDLNPVTDTSSNRLRIRVGTSTFTATLLSNPTVTAFKARLPLTLSMKELNGNEKFANLSSSLPTNATNPGTIQAGDLTLYGANTLVLFYESFRTSYSYTKLGRIDNPSGLAAALGSGNVTVSFALE
ncbi:hypothetical protein GCM10028808_56420 [Spirosoma migulaei]